MNGDSRLSVLRPRDLLVLDFELVNLQPSEDGTQLVAQDPAAESFVVVHFPPQALAEAVWTTQTPDPPPIRTALAGPSRLAFRIPPDATVPLTEEGLLAWEAWDPVVVAAARPRGTPPAPDIPAPALPAATETAIEFPWRLVLSPDHNGRWRTDNGAPDTGTQQLWSAVLHVPPVNPVKRGTAAGADVRAVAAHSGATFVTSLDADTRRQIVQLSSNFHLPIAPVGTEFVPVPIEAKRLELTALGANTELEVKWTYPLLAPGRRPPGYVPLGLVEYQHTAALGRDHFVRTVHVGYLCGTCHRAVVDLTVERLPLRTEVVGNAPGGGALFSAKGYLLKTMTVIVQEPVVDYGTVKPAFAHDGRELPFTNIRLTTKSAQIKVRDLTKGAFWLQRPDETPLWFEAIGTDLAGNPVEFRLPLMFVPFEFIDRSTHIRDVFDHPPFPGATTVELAGQSVAFAPPGDKPGSTVLKIASVRYDIEQPPFRGNPQPEHAMRAAAAPETFIPRFLPRIAAMVASAPAVDDLLGTATPQELVPDPVYLKQGFDPANNRAQTFASFVKGLPLALPTQRGGGLASPDSVANALSRTLGPVSAPEKLQAGTVDLSAIGNTKLLGTIPLKHLLPDLLPFDAAAAGSILTQADIDNADLFVNPPRLTTRRGADFVETRFVWKPPLRDEHAIGPFTLQLGDADLLLDATTRLSPGREAGVVVFGRLRKPKLIFLDALSAQIEELFFRSETGRKIEAGATKVEITFEGPLAFVNALQSILPDDGFDDPPSLTVDAQGVVAGYTLGVPSVGVGIFSIQNIGLSAALSIPFTDRPAGVRFAISERHKPFLVTVSLFGGGGFFAVGVSTKGLEEVEASLEFGGNISLNLGVASGGVSVMAGIYFGMKATSVELTGYLRCGGYLDVLGLISISLEFYLAFTYRDKGVGSEVWGQASLTVKVKIAFFSTSVTLSVERRFAGSDGDPSFSESVSPPAWAGYLQAFA